jgi:hypothetical protein
MKIFLIFYLVLQIGISYTQNKKEQIEILNLKIDSLKDVLDTQNNEASKKLSFLNNKIESVELELSQTNLNYLKTKDSLSILRSVYDSITSNIEDKISEIDHLNNEIKITRDSLKILVASQQGIRNLKNKNEFYSFTEKDYDFNDNIDFLINCSEVNQKEKSRISNSKYASRDVSLNIRLLNNKIVRLKSNSEHEGCVQTHYTYFLENYLKNKLYYLKIYFACAGSGEKIRTLYEIDLKTGVNREVITNTGGDYSFNENLEYLIVSGWYDSEEYAKDNKLELINLSNYKKELFLEEIEPVNINWESASSFQCQLLKYSKEEEWPFSRIPNTNRDSEISKFMLSHGIWVKY